MERQRSHGVPGTAVAPLGIVQSSTFLTADSACLLYGNWAFTIGLSRKAPRHRRSLNSRSGCLVDRGSRVTTKTTLSDGAGSQRGSWFLRRDDGGRVRRIDDLSWRRRRQGTRPIGLPSLRASQRALQDDPRESQKELPIQPVALLSCVSEERACLRTHALDRWSTSSSGASASMSSLLAARS